MIFSRLDIFKAYSKFLCHRVDKWIQFLSKIIPTKKRDILHQLKGKGQRKWIQRLFHSKSYRNSKVDKSHEKKKSLPRKQSFLNENIQKIIICHKISKEGPITKYIDIHKHASSFLKLFSKKKKSISCAKIENNLSI